MIYQLAIIFHSDANLFLRSNGFKRYDVCKVYPLRESHFRIIASARIEQSWDCVEFCTHNEIIIRADAILIVWNYTMDAWIKWESNLRTDHPHESTKSLRVLN